jgi:hypothetical protein
LLTFFYCVFEMANRLCRVHALSSRVVKMRIFKEPGCILKSRLVAGKVIIAAQTRLIITAEDGVANKLPKVAIFYPLTANLNGVIKVLLFCCIFFHLSPTAALDNARYAQIIDFRLYLGFCLINVVFFCATFSTVLRRLALKPQLGALII